MADELTKTARRRRVWCETLPLDRLESRDVLALLRRYDLEVLLAVTPETRSGAARAFRALEDHGVHAALWPMIGDEDGRWASATTLAAYTAYVDAVTLGLEREGVRPREIAFDLEPPFLAAKAASHGAIAGPVRTAMRLRGAYADAHVSLARTVDRLGAALEISCAAVPLVLLDGDDRRAPLYQSLLGTPVDGVAFGAVSIMAYTSMLEGWSRGLLDRRASLGVLGECARLAKARYGPRASLSLGTVGTGAFHDEPTYRDPRELAEDVAVARAFGVDDLTLFDLGGVVRRAPAEAWLDAFTTESAAAIALPRRVSLGSAVLRGLGRLWGRP
jgi:hypothetical protein